MSADKEYKRLFKLYRENPDEYEAEKQRRMYPAITNAAFAEKIVHKKEFARSQSISIDSSATSYDEAAQTMCSSKEFRLSPHQTFVSNFISPQTPYNGLLLFAGVGVGKTASAISVAEKYYDTYKRRTLVVLSGSIKDNFKKQIFDITRYDVTSRTSNQVTGSKYPDMIFDKELMTRDMIDRKVARLIKERYQFIGYKELVVMLQKIEDRVEKIERNPAKRPNRVNEKIREVFGNRLIIIDEAHNLRMPSETGKKQISAAFLNLLQVVENTKLMLMTATPMFNEAREIVWMLNLLLTNDKQPLLKAGELFDPSGKLTEAGQAKLRTVAGHYVSFMRGENPYSFPFRLFPSVNADPAVITTPPTVDMVTKKPIKPIKHLELYGSVMSDYQRQLYDAQKSKTKMPNQPSASYDDNIFDSETDSPELEDEIANDVQNLVQISNVAFQPGKVGRKGFLEMIEKVDNKRLKYRSDEELFAYDNLAKYSPKIKSIIDKVIASKGIVFIYSQFYYSGIYPLAMALEHIGFKKYGHPQGGILDPVASRVNKFGAGAKQPSYIVLSRDKLVSTNNDTEIAAAKSIENADGSLIKVIIVSKIGTEGIDFKRIREVHLLEPWFNMNRIEQIIGRAVRTCSHIDLPKEERNVTIYLHANQYAAPAAPTGGGISVKVKKSIKTAPIEESIDLRMYRISEHKQLGIADVERILKEASIDCPLNQEILNMSVDKLNTSFDIVTAQGKRVPNYKIGDRDGSMLCGFGTCDIKCYVKPPNAEDLDTSTFSPAFIAGEIDLYKKYIGSLFKTAVTYTFDDILEELTRDYKLIDKEVLEYTLDELVESRQSLPPGSGYLIRRGINYVYQAPSLSTRATIQERVTPRYRPGKLDVGKLRVKPKPTATPIAPTSKTPVLETTGISGIIMTILKRYKSVVDLVAKLGYEPFSQQHIVDSIVDKLTQEELKQCISCFTDKPPKVDQKDHQAIIDNVFKSLIATKMFITGAGSAIQYFYNHFDDKFYNATTMKVAGPIEIAKIKLAYDALMKQVDANKDKLADIKGYVGMNRKSEPKFKLKDNPTTSGYICEQTSLLEIDSLKDRVGYKADGRASKSQLCIVYELQMRAAGTFLRPFGMRPTSTK